ncbi:hypothetical protein ACH5RR_001413 [Cinchona calisaya]|uniref:Uncharacterized protein n=1 Tax=Cinchona calisaya TaxID=153742 RepID=A0ABD3B4I9_9GENT
MEDPRDLDIASDLHIYDRKNILVNEDSHSVDSEELLSLSSSFVEEGNNGDFHDNGDDVICGKYGNVDVDENGNLVINLEIGLERNREEELLSLSSSFVEEGNNGDFHDNGDDVICGKYGNVDVDENASVTCFDHNLRIRLEIPLEPNTGLNGVESVVFEGCAGLTSNESVRIEHSSVVPQCVESALIQNSVMIEVSTGLASAKPAMVKGFTGTTESNSGTSIAVGFGSATAACIFSQFRLICFPDLSVDYGFCFASLVAAASALCLNLVPKRKV